MNVQREKYMLNFSLLPHVIRYVRTYLGLGFVGLNIEYI